VEIGDGWSEFGLLGCGKPKYDGIIADGWAEFVVEENPNMIEFLQVSGSACGWAFEGNYQSTPRYITINC